MLVFGVFLFFLSKKGQVPWHLEGYFWCVWLLLAGVFGWFFESSFVVFSALDGQKSVWLKKMLDGTPGRFGKLYFPKESWKTK